MFTYINTFLKSKKEFETKYNFVIDKIEITPTKRMVFFKDNQEINLWNYTIMDNEDVLVGDLIYKEKCSKYLYIYRKDKQGLYKEHLKYSPRGIFSNWFCKGNKPN